jgi:Tol biopolymer transport system component
MSGPHGVWGRWAPWVAFTLVFALVAMPSIAFGAITTTRVSLGNPHVEGGGASDNPAISADGRFVAFASASTNWGYVANQVYVRDTLLGTTELISVSTDGILVGDHPSDKPAISADGRFVAFMSQADNLVGDQPVGTTWNVFVRDRLYGTTNMMSVSTNGARGNNGSYDPAVSANGRYVAFDSDASNLVANDNGSHTDVFVHDCLLQTTTLLSRASGISGTQGSDVSNRPAISADGRYVAFDSNAPNLVLNSGSQHRNVFIRDTVGLTTTLVSVAPDGTKGDNDSQYASISADGRYVAFESLAANLLGPGNDQGGHWDIFVHDTQGAGGTEIMSTGSIGQGNDNSHQSMISADGRYVAFGSDATNLLGTSGDQNNKRDVFLRDRLAHITERLSVGANGPGDDTSPSSGHPAVSADGRCIAFDTAATNLLANSGDANHVDDVYVADRGRLAVSVTRSPGAANPSYTRTHGVAHFTLAATLKDSRGVKIGAARIYLQSSKTGTSHWTNVAALTTNAAGVASRAFSATSRSTKYYRWVVPQTDADFGTSTSRQKVVVR